MRRLIVLAASLVPLLAFSANDVSAQALSGGGFHGGGARMGGALSGGGRALSGGGFGGYRAGLAGGGYGFRGGYYRGGGGWGYRPGRWYGGGGYYGRPGYWRRGYYGGGWGWGAGALAAGAILGSAAAYPYYYGAPYYDEPAYYYRRPYYAAPVSSGVGDYCQTPVRTCQLINPSNLGGGCSCRVAGGRARGTVIP
ncbi:MAG: hypothetical protein C0458_16625 [Methylobacterium sp.]|nr:hypothetical protein [Methylobacterium sp.]